MANDKETKELAIRGEMGLAAQEFFEALDHKDVVKQLRTRVEGAWIYQFPVAGKQVVNLGVDGAVETAIALAQMSQGKFVIEAIPGTTSIQDFGDSIDAETFAGLFTKGFDGNGHEAKIELTRISGYCSQPKHKKKRDGGTFEVQHPRIQAVHKAQRNAFNKLIPEKLRKTIIAIAQKEGKVEQENGRSSKPAPKQTKKTHMANGGTGSAFEGQLNEIGKLLTDEDLPEKIRDQCDAAVKAGLTSKQAEAWMGTLKDAINRKKAKDGELNV
jgi:hypothetical protein